MIDTTYSGLDITVWIDGEKTYRIQSITISRHKVGDKWLITGSMKLLVLNDGAGKLADHIEELKLSAANEYGQAIEVYTLQDINITGWSCEVSIDQIVTEESYDFVAQTFIPGKRLDLVPVGSGETIVAKGSLPKGLCDIAIALTEKTPGEQLRLITLREIFEEKP